MKSQRFDVKKRDKDGAHVRLFKNDSGQLVDFGDGAGCFELGNEKSDVWWLDLSRGFVGIENTTVTGKKNREDDSPVATLSQPARQNKRP